MHIWMCALDISINLLNDLWILTVNKKQNIIYANQKTK